MCQDGYYTNLHHSPAEICHNYLHGTAQKLNNFPEALSHGKADLEIQDWLMLSPGHVLGHLCHSKTPKGSQCTQWSIPWTNLEIFHVAR